LLFVIKTHALLTMEWKDFNPSMIPTAFQQVKVLSVKSHGEIVSKPRLIGRKLLFQVMNQTFKGVYAALGAGSGPTYQVIPIRCRLHISRGLEGLYRSIIRALSKSFLENGDIVTIASKPIAIAQGRVIPIEYFKTVGDPLYMSKEERKTLSLELSGKTGLEIDENELIGLDFVKINRRFYGVLLPLNANMVAFEISKSIRSSLNKLVDVVIVDTDAGWKTGKALIGLPTLVSTPIGATSGLSIAHCIRVAAASSITMGSGKGVPIVIIKPQPGPRAENFRRREGLGLARSYPGRLNINYEPFFRVKWKELR